MEFLGECVVLYLKVAVGGLLVALLVMLLVGAGVAAYAALGGAV